MFLDKKTPEEKVQIAWGINLGDIGRPLRYTTSISSIAFATAETYAGVFVQLGRDYKKGPSCYDYESTSNAITVICNMEVENKPQDDKLGLIDIEDIIKEITATDEGKVLWEEAQDKVNAELWDKVKEGRMSKVKYFRIIKGFTQKEVADKVGMKQPDISRIEQPGYKGALGTYRKLAEILDIEYKDLIP